MEKEIIVQKGYNSIAKEYHHKRYIFSRKEELKHFASLLPKKAKILDAGCGSGIPVSKFLVNKGFHVIGVDISESMLKLARKNVPKAKFVKESMTDLKFSKSFFDGITAFYSIIHVPREKHIKVFKTFYRILKPKGVILISLCPDEWEGIANFHGEKMFWSYYAPKKSLKIIKDVGFNVLLDRVIEDGNEKHYWIIAQKKN